MHFTPATVAVGRLLVSDPNTEHWAHTVAHDVGVKPSTVAAVMGRMYDAGWLTLRLEPQHGARARHLYQLTDKGQKALDIGLREAADKPAPTAATHRGPRSLTQPRPTGPRPTGTFPECLKTMGLRTDGLLPGHSHVALPQRGLPQVAFGRTRARRAVRWPNLWWRDHRVLAESSDADACRHTAGS